MSDRKNSKKTSTGLVDLDTPRLVAPRRKFRSFTVNLMYLAANGLPNAQIASTMGIQESRVVKILACLRVKKEVAAMAFRISGENPQKAFMRLLPETIDVQAQVMRDPKEKGAIRLMAANNLQDRALGKPKQHVDINHKSQARQILELLQNERNGLGSIETTYR